MSKNEANRNEQSIRRRFRKRCLIGALISVACLASIGSAGAQMLPLAHAVDGRTQHYIVQAGDKLTDLSSRFGEDRNVLVAVNHLDSSKALVIGRVLTIDNRHIVPVVNKKDDIYINLAQRRLFYFKGGQLVHTYLIGAGDPGWQTPIGPFHIINHIKGKTWIVPQSIQAEMRAHGQPVITSMPPGPNNPLGGYWMGTSLTNIGIHGTNDPDSIYRYASHGCMHMRAGDIEDLFNRVKVGDQGETVYSPVLLAALPDGRIYLEAHPDVYHKDGDALAEVKAQAAQANISDFIDWDKASQVLAKRQGFAIRVGMRGKDQSSLMDWMNGKDASQGSRAAEANDPDHTSNPDAMQTPDRAAGDQDRQGMQPGRNPDGQDVPPGEDPGLRAMRPGDDQGGPAMRPGMDPGDDLQQVPITQLPPVRAIDQ